MNRSALLASEPRMLSADSGFVFVEAPLEVKFPDELRVDELLLRAPRAEDAEVLVPGLNDPELGGMAGHPSVDPAAFGDFLRDLAGWKEAGVYSLFVVEDDTGKLLGASSLKRMIDLTGSGEHAVEIAGWLFEEARGRGVATRCGLALVEHLHAQGVLVVHNADITIPCPIAPDIKIPIPDPRDIPLPDLPDVPGIPGI